MIHFSKKMVSRRTVLLIQRWIILPNEKLPRCDGRGQPR